MSLLSSVENFKAEVITALNYLAAQGYEDNPFIQLIRARALFNSGASEGQIAIFLHKALKTVSERYSASKERNAFWTIDSSEAAYFNRESAYMFNKTGDDAEFQDRDWTARFYSMGDQEKAGLQVGDIIDFTPPGPDAIGTPRPFTESQEKLNEINRLNRLRLKQEADIDKGTQINELSDPEAGDSGTLTATRENVRTQVWNRKAATNRRNKVVRVNIKSKDWTRS